MALLHAPEKTEAAGGVLTRWHEAVRRFPERPALTSPGESLSFAETDVRSDLVAAGLTRSDAGTSGPVGVLVEPTAGGLAALLGALKTGRPVVPLDPRLPADRLRQVAQQAGLEVCVVDDSTLTLGRTAADGVCAVLPLAEVLRDGADAPRARPVERIRIIVFTSGSTGRPKGVVLTEGLLLASVEAARIRLRVTDADRFTLVFPVAFVAGIATLLQALLNGCGVWAYDPRDRGMRDLAGFLDESRVTLLNATPFLVRSLMSGLEPGRVLQHLRLLVTAGESVHGRDVETWRTHLPATASYVNNYGSSEVGGVATREWTASDALPNTALPAGIADPTKELSILGEDGSPVEPGAMGELHITSHDLAEGYWDEPERSARLFRREADGRRTFGMGDLARVDADGDLHVLGRIDGAVKVRGYLVALLEVEAALLTLPGVAEAAVKAVAGTGGTARLVAYVSSRPDRRLDSAAGMRRRLREALPEYMVPATIVPLREMPHNERGKIDRATLPAAVAVRGSLPPATPTETFLADLWSRVLGLEAVAADDDFLELGGDSLDTEELLTLVEERFGVRLTSGDLVEAPTVREFARKVAPGTSTLPTHPTMVPLRTGGSRRPLFCFAGGGALALSFLPIARHLHDRPVYSFQAAGFESRTLPDWSVARAARRHLQMIRVVQPQGPYVLAGHSFGGLVALEVAQQLTAAGEQVELVALLDSYVPPSGRSEPSPGMTGATETIETTGNTGIRSTSSWRTVQDSASRVVRRLLPDGLPPLRQVPERARVPLAGIVRFAGPRQATNMFNHAQVVARNYRLAPFAGRTAAVIAHGNPDGADGWRRHLRGSTEFLDLPCDHNALMRDPFAAEVAAWLERQLDAARS
jgi:acyl-coenzyme A synthetase/AMP-(fatty) acid ligase/thioesterase domain-containing protein/acyl carrier protein